MLKKVIFSSLAVSSLMLVAFKPVPAGSITELSNGNIGVKGNVMSLAEFNSIKTAVDAGSTSYYSFKQTTTEGFMVTEFWHIQGDVVGVTEHGKEVREKLEKILAKYQ